MEIKLPENFEAFVESEARETIDLKTFSELFFPMFVARFSGKTVELSRWCSYTNTSGHQWVDVVDSGEVIFSVPPVLQSISTTVGTGLQQDPHEIINIARLKDNVIPGSGNRHIKENLTEKLDLEDDLVKGMDEYTRNWIPIFQYYGYELEDSSKSTNVGGGASDTLTETFNDYDEF